MVLGRFRQRVLFGVERLWGDLKRYDRGTGHLWEWGRVDSEGENVCSACGGCGRMAFRCNVVAE